jgi:hypothetical protein
MLDILLHHWATYVYLGWLLVVILGNALTWKNGGSVRSRKPLPLGSRSPVQSGSIRRVSLTGLASETIKESPQVRQPDSVRGGSGLMGRVSALQSS